MGEHVQVLTTVGSEEEAERIAEALVGERLAEIIATEIVAASPGYLAWIDENVEA